MLVLSQYHIFESYKINIYSASSTNTVCTMLQIFLMIAASEHWCMMVSSTAPMYWCITKSNMFAAPFLFILTSPIYSAGEGRNGNVYFLIWRQIEK
jgi:hypothetical protein